MGYQADPTRITAATVQAFTEENFDFLQVSDGTSKGDELLFVLIRNLAAVSRLNQAAGDASVWRCCSMQTPLNLVRLSFICCEFLACAEVRAAGDRPCQLAARTGEGSDIIVVSN